MLCPGVASVASAGLALLKGRAWARGGRAGLARRVPKRHPWTNSRACPLALARWFGGRCSGRERPRDYPRPPSARRAPSRPWLVSTCKASACPRSPPGGRGRRCHPGPFPLRAGQAAAPALLGSRLRAPRAPGPRPGRPRPGAPAPRCCERGLQIRARPSKSQRRGGCSLQAEVFWGPGRRDGGGAGRRAPACGRNAERLWERSERDRADTRGLRKAGRSRGVSRSVSAPFSPRWSGQGTSTLTALQNHLGRF